MEHLIGELHNPANQSSPKRINEIQKQIQRIQREKTAWQLGLDLLHHEDSTVRFYGALTLTIKINADWVNDQLGDDERMRNHLLEVLVTNYLRLVNLPDSNLVLQKLGSTLITFFSRPDSGWRFPIKHTLACMVSGRYVSEESLPDAEQLLGASNAWPRNQLRGVLLLAMIMVEDLSSHSHSTMTESKLSARMASNCLDALLLLKYCTHRALGNPVTLEQECPGYNSVLMESTEGNDIPMLEVTIRAIPYWVNMAKYADSEETHSLEGIARDCIRLGASCLQQDPLTRSVLQMLVSLEYSSSRLLRDAITDFPSVVFSSHKCKQMVESLLENDESDLDGLIYVDLLESIMSHADTTKPDFLFDQGYAGAIQILQRLLRCEGIAVIEDPICQVVLEKISEIVEGYTDWEDPNEHAENLLRALAADACEACLLKIKIPDSHDWDADERAKFQDFRYDVQDFYQSAFTVLGNSLIEDIVKTILGQDGSLDWSTFEAGTFCLIAFSDTMSSEPDTYDGLVTTVLHSQAWVYLLGHTDKVPDRALQTAIKFIAENVGYLNRHADKLVSILNFLFSSLHLEASTSAASRAIYNLCDSNRGMLGQGLPQFMSSLASLGDIGEVERHRIYGAVAAIIQALPSDQAKVEPMKQLLAPIGQAMESLVHNDSADKDEMLRGCTDIVQTLASVGKGIRSPADVPIELDAPGTNTSDFWTSGPGALVQQIAFFIYHTALQRVQPDIDNAFTDACCDFVKSGFTETHPSPFKFEDAMGLELVRGFISVDNPSIDHTMACATSFLASVSTLNIQSSVGGILYAVMSNQHRILSDFQRTGQLPSSSFPSGSFDFLGRFLGKWGNEWFSMPDSHNTLGVAMELGLVVMADTDTLPRRSAAAFFAAFVDAVGSDSGVQSEASTRSRKVLEAFGSRIVFLLVRLLGGECARSELESLSETVKRFVQRQPMLTKTLFRKAVKEESRVMNEKALKATTLEQRNRFISQIEMLRGARKTNEVVKEFWIACRGDGFGYIA